MRLMICCDYFSKWIIRVSNKNMLQYLNCTNESYTYLHWFIYKNNTEGSTYLRN